VAARRDRGIVGKLTVRDTTFGANSANDGRGTTVFDNNGKMSLQKTSVDVERPRVSEG
jgi:hypothetical protein